jgi:hypothetical protein
MSMILECQLAEHISFPLEVLSVAGVESLHCYPRLSPLENEISYTLITVKEGACTERLFGLKSF